MLKKTKGAAMGYSLSFYAKNQQDLEQILTIIDSAPDQYSPMMLFSTCGWEWEPFGTELIVNGGGTYHEAELTSEVIVPIRDCITYLTEWSEYDNLYQLWDDWNEEALSDYYYTLKGFDDGSIDEMKDPSKYDGFADKEMAARLYQVDLDRVDARKAFLVTKRKETEKVLSIAAKKAYPFSYDVIYDTIDNPERLMQLTEQFLPVLNAAIDNDITLNVSAG